MVSSSTQPSNGVEDTFETTDSQYDEAEYDDEDYDEESSKVSVATPTTQKTTTPVRVVAVVVFFFFKFNFVVCYHTNHMCVFVDVTNLRTICICHFIHMKKRKCVGFRLRQLQSHLRKQQHPNEQQLQSLQHHLQHCRQQPFKRLPQPKHTLNPKTLTMHR